MSANLLGFKHMRSLAKICFAAAFVLLVLRFCTGLVHGEKPTASYLVLKAPSLAFARKATAEEPPNLNHLLDSAEPKLVYEKPYVFIMNAAPIAIAVLVVAGLVFHVTPRKNANGNE